MPKSEEGLRRSASGPANEEVRTNGEAYKMREAEINKSDVNRKTNLNLKRRSTIATRAARGIRWVIAIVLASARLLFLGLAAGGIGSNRSAPSIPGQPGSRTFVTAYGNIVQQVEYGLTPESVGVTSDGGYIALAHTDSPRGTSVNWLLKLNASGRPQWQRQLECVNSAEGDYALGLSAQQTSDGGYILGGGIEGCGYSFRALGQKVESQGVVVWAFAYPAGAGGSAINQIKQTADGGYIAVGSVVGADVHLGALILKLDGAGTVQWQRRLDPTGSAGAYFNAVQQTTDGGYVTIGESYVVGQTYPYPN